VREPDTKSRLWSKKNLNFETKIKTLGFSTTAIPDFGVSNRNSRGIREIDFAIFKIKLWAQKIKILI